MAVKATVVRGHGVASGSGGDPRFPDGTLTLQFPVFAERGLDLSGFHPGTINLDIAPATYQIREPQLTLTNVKWHPDCPAETFSFFACQIQVDETAAPIDCLIYHPHPETKPEHFQSPNVLEVLAPKLPDIRYGQTVYLKTDPAQIEIQPNEN